MDRGRVFMLFRHQADRYQPISDENMHCQIVIDIDRSV